MVAHQMIEDKEENGMKRWRVAAWYYVPSVIICDIPAGTADEALDLLRRKMDQNPDFWKHQELDHNSASPNNIEIWDDDGKLVRVEMNASLHVGDKEGVGYPRLELNRIVEEIHAYEDDCEQVNGTDTGELWSKLHDWRERLTKLFEPRELPF